MQKFCSKLFRFWAGLNFGFPKPRIQGLRAALFATLYFKFKWSYVATKHPSAHTPVRFCMLKDFVYRIRIRNQIRVRVRVRVRFKCEFISNENITKVKDRALLPRTRKPPWQKGHFWA